jgi:phosphoglycerate kinase
MVECMRTIRDADVSGKRVIVRVDYNVPLTEKGEVADDRRIAESLPTINHLISKGARVVLMSHLGRPKGPDPSQSLRPVAQTLSKLLGHQVGFVGDVIGAEAEAAVSKLSNGEAVILENLRFNPGEEANDPAFATALARLGDLFVEDAFGSVHRAHASTVGVAGHLPAYAGFLVEKEARELQRLVKSPEKPFVAILGGAKVKDKLPLLRSLCGRVDTLIVGGAMAIPLIHPSSIQDEKVRKSVTELETEAKKHGVSLVLPLDWVVKEINGDKVMDTPDIAIPDGYVALDIGRRSRELFRKHLSGAKTVFFNGPLGKAEDPAFAKGTFDVLSCLKGAHGVHISAGGDTARVISDLGLEGAFTYMSTGGGAALEFIEGRELPGLSVIP